MKFYYQISIMGLIIQTFTCGISSGTEKLPYFSISDGFSPQITCEADNLEVNAITSFTAEFNYKAQCSEAIEHGVCFDEKPNPMRGKSQKVAFYKGFPLDIPAGTKFKVNAENLIPETKYYARAYVKNLDGNIFYSKEISFATSVSDSLLYPKREEIDGQKKTYYKNGQLMRSFSIKNGQIDGLVQIFSESGLLQSEQAYRDGVMEGTLTTFYPNGQMRSVTTFINNQIQGPAKEFYENGSLKKESNFTGEPFRFTGRSASYYEDEKLESEATYSEGKLVMAISYDHQGRITLEQSPGQSISYSYESDGWKHTHINGEKCECARCND